MNLTTTTTTTMYLSKQGMKDLKKAIHNLEREQKEMLQALRELDKTDGRDERFERIEKLSALEAVEAELNEKKQQLATARPLPRKRDALKVALGSVVDLVDTTGRMVRYTLVDSIEANPSDGRISVKSPLGQSLIGKTISDTVKWGSGMKSNQFQLVRIS